jgi:hypothetical protein
MEKRACKRIPSSIDIKYHLWNPPVWKKEYFGTIENLSEKGMLISTKTPYFPRDSLLEIFIPFKEKVVFIPVIYSNIIWRSILSDQSCDRIGIELSNPPQDYLEFVKSLKDGDNI